MSKQLSKKEIMDQQTAKKALTLKTLTKSNAWDIQENDIFRLWEAAEKDSELKDNIRHYTDIIRSAFMIEEINGDSQLVKSKYEKMGYKVGTVKLDEDRRITWATDLREHTPHHSRQADRSARPQLRRRMGLAVAEHQGHH